MDVEDALAVIREVVDELKEGVNPSWRRLTELTDAWDDLDGQLCSGAAPPGEWRRRWTRPSAL